MLGTFWAAFCRGSVLHCHCVSPSRSHVLGLGAAVARVAAVAAAEAAAAAAAAATTKVAAEQLTAGAGQQEGHVDTAVKSCQELEICAL